MVTIKFGTSGWRAFLADEFTFPNVRICCQAIADLVKERGLAAQGVIVGYDPRFLGERFAGLAAEVMAENGITAYLTDRETPTPTLAYECLRRKAAGIINFTASHNPAAYQGIKFSPETAGPAGKDVTDAIETLCKKYQAEGLPKLSGSKGRIEMIDPKPDYLSRLSQLVDLKVIAGSGMKILVNPLHGAGRGYTDEILRAAGADVVVMNEDRDPYFGGEAPEPAEAHIPDMIERMKQEKFDIGLANDGDADRFGIVDRGGKYIPCNTIVSLVADYLASERGISGALVRSVATTHLMDEVARLHKLPLRETAVGFKYIAEVMEKEEILLGGEESGGLTIHGHIPEKDGVLACLLMAEMVARRGKSVTELTEDLFKRIGRRILSDRINLKIDDSKKDAIISKVKDHPPTVITGKKVVSRVTIDGHKFVLEDGSWVMVRFSGTEPVVRCYTEAASQEELKRLAEAGRELVSL